MFFEAEGQCWDSTALACCYYLCRNWKPRPSKASLNIWRWPDLPEELLNTPCLVHISLQSWSKQFFSGWPHRSCKTQLVPLQKLHISFTRHMNNQSPYKYKIKNRGWSVFFFISLLYLLVTFVCWFIVMPSEIFISLFFLIDGDGWKEPNLQDTFGLYIKGSFHPALCYLLYHYIGLLEMHVPNEV